MRISDKLKIVGVAILFAIFLASPNNSRAAFGLTTTTSSYAVDTGAGLVFTVNRSSGDITSLVFNGVEYLSTSKNSQIASGLGSDTTVLATTYGTNYIKIAITTSPTNGVVTGLTQYLMAKNGVNTIYMATYVTAEPSVGELRWITRLQSSPLSNGPWPSDNRGAAGNIESTDVYYMADGTSRSKYYGDTVTHGKDRAMDLTYCGATGSGVGVWMVYDPLRESSSGGPFFRDIQNQCGTTDQEIYNYMNSGHNQTEAVRVGGVLNGPYALVFNNGVPPVLPIDYSWIDTGGLGLQGWVSAAGRGVVVGAVTGVPAGFQAVVGFASTNAQYWTVATNGNYTSPLMKPDTYTVTLYKQELAVATASVTVGAGTTNTLNLASTESNPAFVFKLGEWDGTPAGFLNAASIPMMHPTDTRNAAWTNLDLTMENNPTAQFPAIQARAENTTLTLRFNLTAAQAAVTHTVRIGITCAYNNGRPKISVNSWQPGNPTASGQPDSRSYTIGTYRGNYALYTYSVPASAFVTGQNVMTIFPISGNSDLGGWLSAGYVFDCVQLDGTPIAPLAPTNVVAALNPSQVSLAWTPVFNAVSYNVKRSGTRGGPYTAVVTNIAVAAYGDTNVVAATRYYYVVTAVNSVGESTNSAEVVAGDNPALTLYLPFDENAGTNATDATGHGWNGVLLNGASWIAGKYASAANLNGTSNYISLPADVVSTLADFTIAAWVNQTSVTNWARVFDFGNGTASYMMLTPRAVSSSGTMRFAITVASTGGEQQINGPSALPTGWHHVAVTLNGTVGILYVDGVAVGTNSALTLKPSSLNLTTQNYIGKSQWPDPYLNGRVDDFRIYNGALSAAQISALVSSPSFAPTNLTATVVSANQVNLKWNAASGATDYSVLRSTTSGGPYTTIATGVTATNYSDTGLNGSTTYYYVVAGVDNIGAAINSAPVGVTTLVAPAAPTNLVVSALTPGQIDLTWNASAGATNYLVKRATTSGGPYTIIATNATTSFSDTGLTGGTTNYYVVSALGVTGQSLNSAEAAALTLPTLQAYLKFDEASGTTAADATGHGWTGTLVNSPAHIAGYSNNAVNFASSSSQYATLPTGVVSNLNDFTIAAWVKQTTVTSWSRLFDFGTGTTSYMFLVPSNGASSVVRFAITTGGSSGEQQINGTAALPTGVWKHVAVTLSGGTGILYVDGVAVGTNSAMTLKPSSLGSTTQNYLGKSQYSDPYLNGQVDEFRIYSGALAAGDVATLVTPLTAPTGFAAAAGDGLVTLSWSAVVNATSYSVLRSLANGGSYAQIAVVAGTGYTNTALLNGTNYFYVVKAANAAGQSAASAPASARPVSPTPPLCRAILNGSNLTLSWPADHTGWRLLMQTNNLASGLSQDTNDWATVATSPQTNQMILPLNPSWPQEFYRLVYP
jgi:rhamnogalacturonan endolyase